MTTDAHQSYPMAGRDFLRSPSITQRLDSLRRARRHTKLVTVLKIALPVLALATLGLYFISPKIQLAIGDMEASVAGVVIDKGNLRMVNPKLEGVNKKQGAYVVTAKYAEQSVSNPDFIRLTELDAEMKNPDKSWSRMTSPKGMFETKTEKLELLGDIRVTQSNGMKAKLTRANIDLKAQIVVSDQPVRVDFTGGKVDSRAMTLDMDNKEVEFLGNVEARVVPQKKEGASPKSDAPSSSLAGAFKSDAPIDIYAPKLTIKDESKIALFTGGVTTDQAGSQMTSNELRVVYSGETQAKPRSGNAASVKSIVAIGDVRIRTTDGRGADAATLNYDAVSQVLTLDQDVVVTQGDNTLRGKRMISNLATGITRFPPLGRVQGHFKPAGEPTDDGIAQAVKREITGPAQLDLSSTKGQPIDIEADMLNINDKTSEAEFIGRVNARQGKMTMRSAKLLVNYSGDDSGSAAPGANAKIKSIRAEGRVLINTGNDQATTSDWALYRASDQTMTIGGNVVLTQGENVIKGDELVIDMKTNRSRFVNRGDSTKRKRVRGLFMPNQGGFGQEKKTAPAQ